MLVSVGLWLESLLVSGINIVGFVKLGIAGREESVLSRWQAGRSCMKSWF